MPCYYSDKKPFLMGSEPCEEDCAVFGLLAQCVWHMPGSPHEMYIKGKNRSTTINITENLNCGLSIVDKVCKLSLKS